MIVIEVPTQFEWDRGNKDKNLAKHNVSDQECEEVFFDTEKRILNDILHSGKEKRYILVGKTKKERLLFIVFTLRKDKLRVISARDINKREIKLYHG